MNFLKNEKGNITILVTVVMIALLGALALVLDIGVVYAERIKLVNALDAALLAGGQELPDNKTKAKAMMEIYLVENDVSLDEVTIVIDDDGLGATITGFRDVDHIFGQVLGFDTSRVNGQSKIMLGPASSASGGLRPFAIEKFPYNIGDNIILKEDAGDGYNGNYGSVSLGGTGSSVLLVNALYGYDGVVSIGDWIDTEPGNMATVTNTLRDYFEEVAINFDLIENDSDRLWTVPLVDTLTVDGRDSVQVVGFAQIYVTEVTKQGGQAEIYGQFVQFVTSGEIDLTIDDTGVYGMKLIN